MTMIRAMTIEDYDQRMHFGRRSKDLEFAVSMIQKKVWKGFLKRNPTTSVVAVKEGKIVGRILCGHDGRRGCLYHVCVDQAYRRHGIGKAWLHYAMTALQRENINKITLIAFTKNDIGNAFWNTIGWTERRM